jgi:antitoxin component YwqK of YwqJK toxin-antitoxin module
MRFVILFVVSGLLLGAKGQKGECPDGSRAVGDHPPNGWELICWKDRRWKHGMATTWHDNGQKKSEGEYRKDQRHGKWTWWHASGKKKEEGEYKDGELNGKWTLWHDNGFKELEGEYKDGKFQGKLTIWYANGQKARQVEYKDGKMVGKATCWDKAGTEITCWQSPAVNSPRP